MDKDTYNRAEQEEDSDEEDEGKGRHKSGGGHSDGSPAIAAASSGSGSGSDSIRGERLKTAAGTPTGGAEKEQHSTEVRTSNEPVMV